MFFFYILLLCSRPCSTALLFCCCFFFRIESYCFFFDFSRLLSTFNLKSYIHDSLLFLGVLSYGSTTSYCFRLSFNLRITREGEWVVLVWEKGGDFGWNFEGFSSRLQFSRSGLLAFAAVISSFGNVSFLLSCFFFLQKRASRGARHGFGFSEIICFQGVRRLIAGS